MPPIVNPTTFTITDPSVALEAVTSFNIEAGTASGRYTQKVPVPVSSVTPDANGNYVLKISDLHLQLASGIWYAAATAVNVVGESDASAEIVIQIVQKPNAPGFSAA